MSFFALTLYSYLSTCISSKRNCFADDNSIVALSSKIISIQLVLLWKHFPMPRLVLLNRWRFNFELLHRCKKSLESQAVFLTSLTEAAHQMKGMCEIALPNITVCRLRTQTPRQRHSAEAGPCCSIRCLKIKNDQNPNIAFYEAAI